MDRWQDLRRLHLALITEKSRRFAGVVEDAFVDIDAALDRLDALDKWIESRGLPLDWQGDLDAWGWVILRDSQHGKPVVNGLEVVEPRGLRTMYRSWIRFDYATDLQRAAAIAIRDGVKP